MKKTVLGRTGLEVSVLGMGGIPIMRCDFEEGAAVVRRAFDRGINFFDTANKYNDSELKMGAALKGLRDRVVIASKSLARDKKTMAEHIDLSLERLGTDHIDIYQLHAIVTPEDLDRAMAEDGAYQALAEARAAGKIGFIGLSVHNLDTGKAACRSGKFDTIQIAFNFIETEPAERILAEAAEQNMGLIGMKPLGGGLLRHPKLCFHFLRQYPQVIPVPGFQTIEEADQVIDLYNQPIELTEADREEIAAIKAELGDKFCHRCEYCMPCDQGIKIPKVLHFRSIAARYAADNAVKWAGDLFDSVDDCIGCEICIGRCPYQLPIPDLLKECAELYDRKKKEAVGE